MITNILVHVPAANCGKVPTTFDGGYIIPDCGVDAAGSVVINEVVAKRAMGKCVPMNLPITSVYGL